MKIRYLSIILIFALFASCDSLLEENPKGLLVGDIAVNDINGLNAQLVGMYGSLQNAWESGFASCAQIAMSMGADDVTTHPASNKADIREFDQFNVNAYNNRQFEVWAGLYKSIQSANNIIVNYEKIEGDQSQIRAIAGEAHFFRGMCYYYLTRWWGKIPIVTTPIYNTSMLEITPSDPSEVYTLIEKDLKQAEEWVGNTKSEPGRINKGTVKAYLAEVYLTQTGWPVKDATKAALAAAKAKEVIDSKATYGFDLHPDFYEMFAGETPEDVFALMFDRSTKANCFYGASAKPGDTGGWDDFFAEINFFNNFPEGSRKDATFLTSDTKSDGTVLTWQDFAVKHPYYRKFTIQRGKVNSYASNMPVILMRYANVLLVYAEAQARSAGVDASAYDAINRVRKRAGLDDLTAGLSTSAFIDAVIAERGWEFAGEWSRWFDLIRTETVASALQNRDASENALIGDPANPKNWWLPIPGSDKDKNPNL